MGKKDQNSDSERVSLKDLNDITRIAGVNIKEESASYMAAIAADCATAEHTPADDDTIQHPALNTKELQKKVADIGKG